MTKDFRACARWAGASLAALALALPLVAAEAKPLKWARSGDALTLDPHSQNEGPTHNLLHQIYDTLVWRHYSGELKSGLAVSWALTSDPTVWEFKLRTGVKFHDGAAFDADDVVFSFERARQPNADMKGLLTSVDSVTKVDATTVRIKTKGPNPLLPNYLTNIFIMDKEWSEKNQTVNVQDFKAKGDNYSVRNANGTGPYVLVSREQDVKTELKRNDSYWGKGEYPLGATTLTYFTIKSDATRLAALLTGEVDFVQDVPVQDIQRLEADKKLRVNYGPENRTIFLGMNVALPELKMSNVKGKNPFADQRVRQALNMVVDRESIKRAVMRGQSVSAGVIAPPFVNGYTQALDTLPKLDLVAAKKLLTDAGYPQGFEVTLHCPNDRYINDDRICQAVAAMMAKIDVKVNVLAQGKAKHFQLIQQNPPETEFFLLGWGVPTYDSHYIFSFLYHTRSGQLGTWNATGYSNPEIDKQIVSLTGETDVAKRNATIAKIWDTVAADAIYVPLHHQTLAYAMTREWDIATSPDNAVFMKLFAPK
jgi:peptide/nickel transport system substrate-binding protein